MKSYINCAPKRSLKHETEMESQTCRCWTSCFSLDKLTSALRARFYVGNKTQSKLPFTQECSIARVGVFRPE